jgi:hypothetical protein
MEDYVGGFCASTKRHPTPEEVLKVYTDGLRAKVRELTAPGREQALALTKIDEAEMWALRGL